MRYVTGLTLLLLLFGTVSTQAVAFTQVNLIPQMTQAYHEKPPEEQAAGAVADALFAAMRAKDAAAIRATFLETGQLTALDQPRTGTGFPKTRHYTAEAFAKLIAEAQAGEFNERMPNKEVKIYGNAAVVVGRYTFHVGDKFSHCGTNAFHLLKTATGWKIANATSTLEFAQCDAPQSNPDATASKDAQATVEHLFALMTAHKPNDIIALHTPEAQLAAHITARDGKTRTENLSREGFAKFFETKRAEIAEKMYAPQTRVFGDLAVVYGRYFFTVNGKLAHCGMNAFHLSRTAEGWRLGNALSTIEPNGCTAEEKTLAANPKP